MNKETVIGLLRGTVPAHPATVEQAVQWVETAISAEREACAKVCDSESSRAMWNWGNDLPTNKQFWNGGEALASSCAESIRARKD